MASLRCSSGSCSARAFVQLARRRYAAPTPATFDFLLPRRCLSTLPPAARRQTFVVKPFASKPTCRSFSTTPVRQATVCVRNPQQDEDGNDMILEITPRAAKRLTQIMDKDKNPNLALRIQVESGGCHGFQYIMSLVTIPAGEAAADASTIKEDDSIFEFVADEAGDAAAVAVPRIILDEPSLDLLKGSKVDFTMELIGSQFKIVDNPLATSSCGCGTSFDIKM